MENIPIWKNKKMLILIGIVASLAVLIITLTPSGNVKKDTGNAKKSDTFEPATRPVNKKTKEQLYREKLAPKAIKDIDIDEAATLKKKRQEDKDKAEQLAKEQDQQQRSQMAASSKPKRKAISNPSNNKPSTIIPRDTTTVIYNQPQRVNGSTWTRSTPDNNDKLDKNTGKRFQAVVFGNNEIVGTSGICKLRLLEPITLDGDLIPRNTIITAKISRSSEYIYISLSDLQINDKVYRTTYEGYTNNGRGIYHKSGVLRSNVKASTGSAISNVSSSVGFSGVPGSSVVGAVGSAAGNALTKSAQQSVDQEAVTIPDGYKILFVSQ